GMNVFGLPGMSGKQAISECRVNSHENAPSLFLPLCDYSLWLKKDTKLHASWITPEHISS
ncbi:hypothetical protein, partial [Escherichia coli]|uniref:hypothetical protein n=1 Tax=Escherichia coli TaxID=562 RepID=UPI001BDB7D4A